MGERARARPVRATIYKTSSTLQSRIRPFFCPHNRPAGAAPVRGLAIRDCAALDLQGLAAVLSAELPNLCELDLRRSGPLDADALGPLARFRRQRVDEGEGDDVGRTEPAVPLPAVHAGALSGRLAAVAATVAASSHVPVRTLGEGLCALTLSLQSNAQPGLDPLWARGSATRRSLERLTVDGTDVEVGRLLTRAAGSSLRELRVLGPSTRATAIGPALPERLESLTLSGLPRLAAVDVQHAPALRTLALAQCGALERLHLAAPALASLSVAAGCARLSSMTATLPSAESVLLFGCRGLPASGARSGRKRGACVSSVVDHVVDSKVADTQSLVLRIPCHAPIPLFLRHPGSPAAGPPPARADDPRQRPAGGASGAGPAGSHAARAGRLWLQDAAPHQLDAAGGGSGEATGTASGGLRPAAGKAWRAVEGWDPSALQTSAILYQEQTASGWGLWKLVNIMQ